MQIVNVKMQLLVYGNPEDPIETETCFAKKYLWSYCVTGTSPNQ